MNRIPFKHLRWPLAATVGAAMLIVPLATAGCDRDVSKSKTTTEKTTQTPDGTKKTTETIEKKVETEHKKP